MTRLAIVPEEVTKKITKKVLKKFKEKGFDSWSLPTSVIIHEAIVEWERLRADL